MLKFIPNFQSFFIADQTQNSWTGLFARTNSQSEFNGKAKSQKLKQAISLQRMAEKLKPHSLILLLNCVASLHAK